MLCLRCYCKKSNRNLFSDLSSFSRDKRNFFIVAEPNVDSEIFEAYRAQAAADLAHFLKLRADELIDNGFGIYLMGSAQGANVKYEQLNFIRRRIFTESFENAALDFEVAGKDDLANLTREALVMVKPPNFERCCEDIKQALADEDLKGKLELIDIDTKECLVDNKTYEGMADFLWSVKQNSIVASLASLADGPRNENLPASWASSITDAVRKHLKLIAERDFADGRHYISYTYFVVKRQSRKDISEGSKK